MKVTLLGHASLLVELGGLTILMDPVFTDPFMDGAVVSCPAREVYLERLPRVDVVFLSHAHFDHFHLRSLARLRRDVQILCPEDPAIPYALQQLGFRSVRTLPVGELVELGQDCQLLTTHSAAPVIEFGVVVKAPTGTLWNEVDTVVNPATVQDVRERMGQVDLLFTGYAAQNVLFFEALRAGYPLGFTRSNLANVKAIRPALAVPGSAGYRFAGFLEWANPFLFPVSRERFLEDLRRVAPEVPSAIANPGDVFEVVRGRVSHHPGASMVARMIEDDTWHLAFDTTAPVPPLVDPNPLSYPDDLIEREVAGCLGGLDRFVRSSYGAAPGDPLVEVYRRVGFTYGLGVLFPDGQERWRHFFFEKDLPRVVVARGPLRDATATHRVAASILVARARYEKSYLYYRGYSRLSQTLFGTQVHAGQVIRESDEPPDLLAYYLANKAPGAERAMERRLDFQIATLARELGPELLCPSRPVG